MPVKLLIIMYGCQAKTEKDLGGRVGEGAREVD